MTSPPFPLLAAGERSAGGSGSGSEWSSLTEPLLLDILRRLGTLHDFFAFRGVCRNWRALAALTPGYLASQHPLLLTHFPLLRKDAYFDAVLQRVYVNQLLEPLFPVFYVAYAHGYLVTIIYDRELVLRNIFSGAVIRLPMIPYSNSPISDYRVIFSSNPSSPDCLVVLFDVAEQYVHYLRIGDRNPFWTDVRCFKGVDVADMIYFKNKLYALTLDMGLLTVDLVIEPKYEVAEDRKGLWIFERVFTSVSLAVSGDDLLVVFGNLDGGSDAFGWDFRSNHWEERRTLDGRALFMGRNSFAGSVDANLTGLRGDCIHSLHSVTGEWTEFSLKDQCFVGAYPLLPGQGKGRVWVFPSHY